MKITPVSSPAQVQSRGSDWESSAGSKSAVERAKAAFAGTQPANNQTTIPIDANNVGVENLSAVKPPNQVVTQPAAEEVQPNLSDNHATQSAEVTPPTPQEIRQQASVDPEQQRRMEALQRQERAFRAKVQQAQQKLNQRDADLRAREEALKTTQPQVDMSKYIARDDIRSNPLQALADAGVTADEFAQAQADYVPTDSRVLKTIQALEAKIEKLNGELENTKQGQTQAQKDAYAAAIQQIRADATKLVNSDPEFEITKSYGKRGVDEVVRLIEKIYAKERVVISVEEAAKEIEDDYTEELASKTKLGKVQKRLGSSSPAVSQTAEAKPQSNQQQQTRTLTNQNSTQRPLTARERAILAFEGKLKG